MGKEGPDRKVLMICYYLPPFPGVGKLRSSKFIKYLPSFGWKPLVLSAYNAKELRSDKTLILYIPNVDFRNIIFQLREKIAPILKKAIAGSSKRKNTEQPDNTHKKEIKVTSSYEGVGTRILRYLLLPDAQFLWILIGLPAGIILARKADVIYSSSLPWSSHVLGMILKKITGKPLVLDYRDEWTLNMNWYPPTRFHRWLGETLERICIKEASYVINVSEARTELFKSHFSIEPSEKFITIHNGFDESDIAPFRKLSPPKEPLTLTSIGSLYGGRDPENLIRAIDKIRQSGKTDLCQKIRINFIGKTDPKTISLIKQLNLTDIFTVSPPVPQNEAFEAVAKSHVALLIGGRLEKVAMTTKVYEYMGLYKPIFAIVPDGQLKEFVLRYGGWAADPSDIDGILNCLEEISRCHKENTLDLRVNKDMVRYYSRENLTAQLAKILEEAIST